MGAISFSIDRDAVALLATTLDLTCFIETGTFKGDSLARVRDLFPRLYSAEIDPELARGAMARFADDAGVAIRQGPSPVVVRELLAEPGVALDDRVFYWLDAHWCESAGTDITGQCPLLDELAAIQHLGDNSVIAIDDARLFLAPPTAAHVIADWPSFDDILVVLRDIAPGHRITVLNDVIWVLPARACEPFNRYAARAGADWLSMAEKERTYDPVMAQLAEKDGEIVRLQATAEERLALVNQIQARNEQLDDGVSALRQALEERQAATVALEQALRAAQESAAARLAVLDQLDGQLKEANADRIAQMSRIASLEATVTETVAARNRFEADLRAANDDRIARAAHSAILESELHALQTQLPELTEATAHAVAESDAAKSELGATQTELEIRRQLIERLDAELRTANNDRIARGEVIGGLQTRINELEFHLAHLDTAIADTTAQAAGQTERAIMLEGIATERATLIDRLDILAREASSRAAAAESARSFLQRETETLQSHLHAVTTQTIDLAASAEMALARAEAAERELEARQVVIDELVLCRNVLIAALASRPTSWIGRLLFR